MANRIVVAAAMTACLIFAAPLAMAQAPGTAPPAPSTMEKIKEMTRKEWSAAKAKWSSEKEKWARCRREAQAQKLTMRQRWTYRVECMTR